MNIAMTHDIKLAFPVTVDAETFTSLNIRRAKVSDQLKAAKAFPNDDSARIVRTIALLAGVADDVIAELDTSDFARVSKVIESFTDLSSETTS